MRSKWMILMLTAALAPTAAAVNYDEGVNGDLSGNRVAPTSLGVLGPGANLVTATSSLGDVEYLTFTVPVGMNLSSLVLEAYSVPNTISFIGVQQGTIFTEDPANPNVANLLGWTHFGTLFNQVGTDILDDIGQGPGAIGFVPPLPAGDYTWWIQEINVPVTYTLNFIVTPVPAPAAVLLLGFAGAWPRRRRGG